MGLKGDLGKLRSFKSALQAMPRTLAADVATRAAPEMTDLTQSAFSSGQSVYGTSRPAGVDGQPLDLERTGATKAQLRFVSIGTVVRCVLGPPYAKYLIRYGILPNGALPVAWAARLRTLVAATPGPGAK